MPQLPHAPSRVAVIGAGPSGLMAAEVLAAAGCTVDVFDAMPSVGRKFLLAGKGGLNLTHAEPLDIFQSRYGEQSAWVSAWLADFAPQDLRDWSAGLGVETFVGSSGRVFPTEMKAAPLLRAWLHRLRGSGVRFHMRHRWQAELAGKGEGHDLALRFDTPHGTAIHDADAVVLALGGASWPQLGSDGAWLLPLSAAGVAVAPLRPANCGFDLAWSAHLAERYAGEPLKNVRLSSIGSQRSTFDRLGECVLTATGLEGQLVYAASALLRDEIERQGHADFTLDLAPEQSLSALTAALAKGRAARSMANHLREHARLSGAKAGLLREGLSADEWNQHSRDPAWLAQRIKALPLRAQAARPIAEAISSAGGVRTEALDEHLMLRAHPAHFCAGEMLDWEAPTGGYLLTAAMASGRAAGLGAAHRLQQSNAAG
jgi:uncharacterized flavoprotein (TIGR03862 family)